MRIRHVIDHHFFEKASHFTNLVMAETNSLSNMTYHMFVSALALCGEQKLGLLAS